jgi:DNA-binding CsgD family transcriptional regulator
MEVPRQLVRGASLVEIASAMNLSEKTVANYQTLIRQKLGVRNAAQLVHAAAGFGIGSESGRQAR